MYMYTYMLQHVYLHAAACAAHAAASICVLLLACDWADWDRCAFLLLPGLGAGAHNGM